MIVVVVIVIVVVIVVVVIVVIVVVVITLCGWRSGRVAERTLRVAAVWAGSRACHMSVPLVAARYLNSLSVGGGGDRGSRPPGHINPQAAAAIKVM